MEIRKRMVVARYKEDSSWTDTAKHLNIDVLVYDKSNPELKLFEDKVEVRTGLIQLANVGKESHTYLRHIVDNYDNLYDFEIFAQGEIRDHVPLQHFWSCVSNLGPQTPYLDLSTTFKYQCMSESTRDRIKAEQPTNPHVNLMDDRTSNVEGGHGDYLGDRDFFEMVYGKDYDEGLYFRVGVHGLFAASRETIRRHPRSTYEMLLNMFDPKLVGDFQVMSSGYKMEHFWNILFTHEPKKQTIKE